MNGEGTVKRTVKTNGTTPIEAQLALVAARNAMIHAHNAYMRAKDDWLAAHLANEVARDRAEKGEP
jgi:hypothetical protein